MGLCRDIHVRFEYKYVYCELGTPGLPGSRLRWTFCNAFGDQQGITAKAFERSFFFLPLMLGSWFGINRVLFPAAGNFLKRYLHTISTPIVIYCLLIALHVMVYKLPKRYRFSEFTT